MGLKTVGAVLAARALFSFASPGPTAAAFPGAVRFATAEAASPSPVPGIEDQIARAVAASRPGREHEWLAPLIGSWTAEWNWYAPQLPSLHLTGSAENRWGLGRRFLISEATAGEGDSRVEGLTVYGYDAAERRFFSVIFDNLGLRGTGQTGTYDPVEQSFILTGRERNPAAGGFVVYRYFIKIQGPDRYTVTVLMNVPGHPAQKVIDAEFKRR